MVSTLIPYQPIHILSMHPSVIQYIDTSLLCLYLSFSYFISHSSDIYNHLSFSYIITFLSLGIVTINSNSRDFPHEMISSIYQREIASAKHISNNRWHHCKRYFQ
jgi:hypothetical protein